MANGSASLQTADVPDDSLEIVFDNYFYENVSGVEYQYYTSIDSRTVIQPTFKVVESLPFLFAVVVQTKRNRSGLKLSNNT